MFFLKKYIYKIFNIIFLFIFALLLTKSALAGVYTAGTNGNYATIQLAIDDAILSPGSNEIHVRAGTYSENIFIQSLSDIGTLNITGGWDSTFSTRDNDYTLTTINGGGTSRVFHISVEGGGSLDLTIDGFTLQDGFNSSYGSGINISVSGTGNTQITINNNRILSNVSSGSYSSRGGGIAAYMNTSGVAVLDITNNLIKDNSIASTADNCEGAGIALTVFQGAVFNITGNVIEDNTLTTDSYAEGAAIQIQKYGSGACDISNNIVRNNSAVGTGDRNGIGGHIYITDSATITLSRNQWLNNVNSGGNACGDVYINTLGTSTVIIKDSLIAGAVDNGLDYSGQATSVISMTNLTITDNGGYGLTGSTPDIASLYNTIIYNNGINYDTLPSDTGNNLIGSDPRFVDQEDDNYRLRPGSPAINAGTNSPTGGLGSLDLDGNIRIMQSTVDIGAYEFKPACNPGVMLLLLN